MTATPYFPLWPADFLGDTLHLTDAEVGQYMLLLMAMWRNGGTLPDDPTRLERVARNPVSESVMAYFDRVDGVITQKRLAAELAQAKHKTQARREAGKQGGKVRALKNKETPQANGVAKPKHLPEPVCSNEQTPMAVLCSVVDEERAKEILEHRRKKRAPNTLRAIRSLAKLLSECQNANAAADEMLLRGWTIVKPGWLTDKNAKVVPFVPSGPKRTWAEIKAERERNNA